MQTKPFHIKIRSPFSIHPTTKSFEAIPSKDSFHFRPETQGPTWPPWRSGWRTTSTPASTTCWGSWRTWGWLSGVTRPLPLHPCLLCHPSLTPGSPRPTPTPTTRPSTGLRRATQTPPTPSTSRASTRWVSPAGLFLKHWDASTPDCLAPCWNIVIFSLQVAWVTWIVMTSTTLLVNTGPRSDTTRPRCWWLLRGKNYFLLR